MPSDQIPGPGNVKRIEGKRVSENMPIQPGELPAEMQPILEEIAQRIKLDPKGPRGVISYIEMYDGNLFSMGHDYSQVLDRYLKIIRNYRPENKDELYTATLALDALAMTRVVFEGNEISRDSYLLKENDPVAVEQLMVKINDFLASHKRK